MPTSYQTVEAHERFRRNVTRAQVADLLGLMTGSHTDLVSYDEVAKRLHARQQVAKGTQMVPMDRIVGSVGRYRDFTRTFLPRAGVNVDRWSRLDAAMHSMEGFPPVELFKIGEAYFVQDGNHRVSVARANGSTHIEAYVKEIPTDIPLTVDDFTRDQWIIKAEQRDFLRRTRLETIRPDHGIELTEPGRYEMMLRHIEVHRYLHNHEQERSHGDAWMSWEDAVAGWYDNVYLPVIQAIRDYDLLAMFPERTEADLYLWIAHHRERLSQVYGLAPLSPTAAVSTFAQTHSDTLIQRTMKGLVQGLHRVLGDKKPMGMSDEEFIEARARHDAGELSLGEAEQILQIAGAEASKNDEERGDDGQPGGASAQFAEGRASNHTAPDGGEYDPADDDPEHERLRAGSWMSPGAHRAGN